MSSGIVCADEVGQKYEQMKVPSTELAGSRDGGGPSPTPARRSRPSLPASQIRKTASFMVMKIQNDQVEV
eukprot:CAMPEP_0118883124 /NCGR_PEP_ID=MMETSP1163-20130328/22249_1 /TAXON_ID=124430 /ORGANISM="Phaeomonas parva, Strain CCMP2877" /LENGTH=69 /DNA_ID=CAMNT_0006820429 /DNA_START=15 /DNA_END=221 /DNA_ORIENTATION=-